MSENVPVWKDETIPLAFPVTVDGVTTAAITLREPDVEALEAVDELGMKEGVKPTVRQVKGMVVALSRESEQVINKIHRDDFKKITKVLNPLFAGGQGETA